MTTVHINLHEAPFVSLYNYSTSSHMTQYCTAPILALFPGLQSPYAVEGLVKLLRKMTSGRRWEVWHFR